MNSNIKNQLVKDELIGLPVTITECTDDTITGENGMIIDETKNMFTIRMNDNKEKKIAKKNTIFEFQYQGDKIRINGSTLAYRPEDRIKKAEVDS